MRVPQLARADPEASPIGDASPEELARVEHEFARMCVERGVTAAFDAHFAADGIWFTPHPKNARQELAAAPPRDDAARTLDWYPTLTLVSAAGDLGCSTGPFVVSAPGPGSSAEHGLFVTLWKREGQGPFRVSVDFGIDVPAPAHENPPSWRGVRGEAAAASADGGSERAALIRREAILESRLGANGLVDGYESLLADGGLLYRQGRPPMRDRTRLAEYLESEVRLGRLAFEPSSTAVARSADLGGVWGRFTRTPAWWAEPAEDGYFVHVWVRERGEWRLAVEALRPLPFAP